MHESHAEPPSIPQSWQALLPQGQEAVMQKGMANKARAPKEFGIANAPEIAS